MTLPKFQTKYVPNLVEIDWMVSKSITDIETFFVFYIYRLHTDLVFFSLPTVLRKGLKMKNVFILTFCMVESFGVGTIVPELVVEDVP